MRNYESKCLQCGSIRQLTFLSEPYPEYGDVFRYFCKSCQDTTEHTRTMTRKTASELRKKQAEHDLRRSIIEKASEYGFTCRFLYQSVIITTPLADWCFDYHESRITLYHESTVKINFETGNYAKAHKQFSERKVKPLEVIDYIAAHDEWKATKASTKFFSSISNKGE